MPFAVNVAEDACPLAPVVAPLVAFPPNEPPAPLAGAANVTATPETGLPPESFSTAMNGLPNAVLTCALCPLPLTTVMLPGAPVAFVNENVAVDPTPAALAVTLYVPAVPFAVNAGETAWPLALVVTVADAPNVALAPDPGDVNVTLTPETGLPPASLTTAIRVFANAVLICAV